MFITWNTAQTSADSLADCFPSLRKDFLIRYARIAAFMERKTHFATVWMSPLLSESRNLIQFHTESIQKSLVFSRRLLPSLLHTNIRSFLNPISTSIKHSDWSHERGQNRDGSISENVTTGFLVHRSLFSTSSLMETIK